MAGGVFGLKPRLGLQVAFRVCASFPLYMPVAAGALTKRTLSAAELTSQEGITPKKSRNSDPPLDRHPATLLSGAVDVNLTILQPEPPTTSQAQMLQIASKPPKGRRRFMADLEELKSTGFSLHGHRLNSMWKWMVYLYTSTYMSLCRVASRRRRRICRGFYLEGGSTSCHH